MAPSGSDYRGAGRGALMLAAMIGLVALVLAVFGTNPADLLTQMIQVLSPVFAVFGLTIVLTFFAAVIVYFLTALIPRFFR